MRVYFSFVFRWSLAFGCRWRSCAYVCACVQRIQFVSLGNEDLLFCLLDMGNEQSVCVKCLSFLLLDLGWKIHAIGYYSACLPLMYPQPFCAKKKRKMNLERRRCVVSSCATRLGPNATTQTHSTPARAHQFRMSSAYEKPKMFNSLKWITTDWAAS